LGIGKAEVALKRPRRYPTNLIYNEFNVPNFEQIYNLNIIMYGRQLSIDNAVNQLNVNTVTTRRRAANHIYLERPNFELFRHSPIYLASRFYNALPKEFKNPLYSKKNLQIKSKKWITSSDTSVFLNSLR